MRSRLWHYTAYFFISFSFDPYCMTEFYSSLSWKGYTSKTNSTNPLWNRAALHNSALGATPSTDSIVCAYMRMSTSYIEYRRSSNERSSSYDSMGVHGSTLHPLSILSSLPSPPFLLACAVRGDINLSDRLCDPPSRLGGRRSAVNINILPGFVADTEQPWPPWIFIHYHKQKHMSPSARPKSMPSPASATLFPSPLQTKNKTVSLLLVLDCLLIFIATQADRLTWHPEDLQTLRHKNELILGEFLLLFLLWRKYKAHTCPVCSVFAWILL